jgi:hypothetical protein
MYDLINSILNSSYQIPAVAGTNTVVGMPGTGVSYPSNTQLKSKNQMYGGSLFISLNPKYRNDVL